MEDAVEERHSNGQGYDPRVEQSKEQLAKIPEQIRFTHTKYFATTGSSVG